MKKNILNKKKKKFFNKNTRFNIFFITIFFFLFLIYLNFEKISNTSIYLIEKYSQKFNYNLIDIKISNLKYLSEDEILKYFDNYKNKSIFLVPIELITKKIIEIKWVKRIDIQSDYKNTLKINIEEEIPFAVYDNDNLKILFSQDLVVLEILQNTNNYSDLIIFYGQNSIKNSKKLILKLDDDIKKILKSATFIENRRWNIQLDNLILLKLPEKNIEEAIENYKKISMNFSRMELYEIENIDLRINKQAIIKYKGIKND